MPADVVERTQFAGRVPDDEDVLALHVEDQVVAWRGYLFLARDTDPLTQEDVLAFEPEYPGFQIPRRRQRRLESGNGLDRHADSPACALRHRAAFARVSLYKIVT